MLITESAAPSLPSVAAAAAAAAAATVRVRGREEGGEAAEAEQSWCLSLRLGGKRRAL